MVFLIDSAQKRFFSTDELDWAIVSAPRKKLLNTLFTYLHLNPIILKKINQVVLINLVGSSISKEKLRRFFNYVQESKEIINERAEYESLFNDVFRKIKIFSKKDLEVKKGSDIQDENFYSYDIKTFNLDSIKNVVKEDRICFLSTELSPLIAAIIIQFENIEGHYKPYWSKKDKSEHISRIENPQEYLNFYLNLYKQSSYGFISNNSLPLSWLELLKTEEAFGKFPRPMDIYNNISRFIRGDIDKIILSGGDEILSEKIAIEIKTKIELLNSEQENQIDNHQNTSRNILIKNINGMNNEELDKFLKNETNRYKKNGLILRKSSKRLSHKLKKNNYVALPDTNRLRRVLPLIFLMVAKERGLLSIYENPNHYDILLKYLFSESLRNYFNSITSLSELEDHINQLKEKSIKMKQLISSDFWYDYLINNKNISVGESFITIGNKNIDDKDNYSRYSYQFLRRENNKIKIVFKGKDVALRNEDLLGLHYLRFIIKYGENGISFQELEIYDQDVILNEMDTKVVEGENPFEEEGENDVNSLTPLEKIKPYDLIDEDTIKSVQKNIDDLKEELEILNNDLKFDEIETKEKKIVELEDYLRKAINIKGEIRTTNAELEKIKRRVKKAVNLALDQIKEDDLNFYSYLKEFVILDKSKNKYFYLPNPDINWFLD